MKQRAANPATVVIELPTTEVSVSCMASAIASLWSPILFTLFIVAVPQEYRIVHRNSKLKNGGKRLCYVRDLTEEVIRPEIDEDHHADD